jgi:hypothetical protein
MEDRVTVAIVVRQGRNSRSRCFWIRRGLRELVRMVARFGVSDGMSDLPDGLDRAGQEQERYRDEA